MMTSAPATGVVGGRAAAERSVSRTCSPGWATLRLLAPTLLLGALCPAGRDALGQVGLAGDDLGSFIPLDEPPADFPIAVNFEMGSFDRYVWRGLRLTDGPVLQPSVTVSRGTLSVNIWGNMDLDDVNGNETALNEIDVTLGWEGKFGLCTTSVAAINYNFPNTAAETTTELHFGAAFDMPSQPAVNVYFDVVQAQGAYVTLDVAHTFSSGYGNPLGWELTLGTGMGWGSQEYNDLYFGVDADGATDFHVGLNFAVVIHDKWTVSQSISYTTIVDDQLRGVIQEDQNVAYGMTMMVKF